MSKMKVLCAMKLVLFAFSMGQGQAYAPVTAVTPLFGEAQAQVMRQETIRAAHAGWAEEQFKAGAFHDEGGALSLDYEAAAFWYGQAAVQGHVQAATRLGQLIFFRLIDENDAPPDYGRACALFKQAAKHGNSEAMLYLGSCALVEHQEPNLHQARQWYERAAHAGIAEAAFQLALTFEDGAGADFLQAAHWYLHAARLGESRAFLPLAQLYYQGNGVEQDFGLAYQWFEKAARRGYREAAFYLGLLYEDGQGVFQDLSQARHWYAVAARGGDKAARYNLALLYEEGRGGAHDFTAAFQLYQQVAEEGDVDALVKIGSFYEQGLGVDADRAKAFTYYQQAATLGDEEMQYYLGLSYSGGEGAELPSRNLTQAIFWLEKAAHQGHSLAQARLDMLQRLGLDGE